VLVPLLYFMGTAMRKKDEHQSTVNFRVEDGQQDETMVLPGAGCSALLPMG